ncbi:MAG: hypothetical protein ACREK7_01815 [Gemmatimonadota bacterium]
MNGAASPAYATAPPVGRVLRGLVGGLMLFPVGMALLESPARVPSVAAVAVGLAGLYLFFHLAVRFFTPAIDRWLGAVLAIVPASAVYLLGGPAGRLGTLGYVGVSLLLASLRADPGCEVMSIPGIVTGRHTHLVCLLFSPLDWLELRLREGLRSN